MAKCHFGVKQVDFLGQTITPGGISPQTDKVKLFFQQLEFPKSKKALQRYIGFLKYYRNYIPRLSKKLSPFFKLLNETSQFCIPNTVLDTFIELNHQLEKSCSLAPKQPIKKQQLILMTDASFQHLVTPS